MIWDYCSEFDEDLEDHEDVPETLREYERSITRHPDGTVTNWNYDSCGNHLL